MPDLLVSAIEARLNVKTGATSTFRFQVILGNDDGEGPATMLGASSSVEVALAMLQAAEQQNPKRKIRVYDESAVPQEVG